jgi:phage N-6-adenine-methyltransferase
MSDLYETPPEVFAYWNTIFRFEVDVCAEPSTAKCQTYMTPKDDALTQPWSKHGTRAWMNPPYSSPAPWIEKALLERTHGVLTLALLPADTSTLWYHRMKNDPLVTLLHPPGRIRFLLDKQRQGSPKFGNVFAIFWPSANVSRGTFSTLS